MAHIIIRVTHFAMKKIFSLLSLLIFSNNIYTDINDNTIKKTVDSFVVEKMNALKIPGLAIAVVRNGEIVNQSVYGTANFEWNVKVSVNTNFQIASCTKLLTSTLLMKTICTGKIQLEDPISKYLDSIPDSWKTMQVKHLITHSSGLKEFKGDLQTPITDVVRALKDSTLEYKPGTSQHYAQADFMLLSFILEKIYAKTFTDLIRDEIAIPLNMKDGGYDMEARSGSFMRTQLIKERATTYYDHKGNMQGYKFMYPQFYYSAGAYFASISDLTNWAIGLDNDKLFAKHQADEMIYGLDQIGDKKSTYTKSGWILENENGIIYAGHSGGPGLSEILRFPREGYTFIVLSNDGELLPGLARAIASFYITGLSAKLTIEKFDR
jgi:CubicO group peptidase (beta-lactamase class C family)